MSRASRPSTNLSTSSIRDCGLPPPPTTTIRSWTPSCPPMWRPRGSQARPQIAPRVPRFRRLCRVCRARAMHRRGALFPLHLCRSQGPAKAQIIDRGGSLATLRRCPARCRRSHTRGQCTADRSSRPAEVPPSRPTLLILHPLLLSSNHHSHSHQLILSDKIPLHRSM